MSGAASRSRLHAYGMKFKTVQGLCTDCRILLSRFEQHNTLRFTNFCQVWKQMHFSVIHYCRPDTKGKRQLVEYLLRIFSGYIGMSCPLQYRVGALYGLYSVYQTQLCKPKVKIRVTTVLWKEIQELHKQIKEQQHYDVDYIIRSLMNSKAFHFVAMPIQLECGSKEAIPDDEKDLGGVKSQTGILQDLDVAYDMVTKLHNVDEEYIKLKASLQNCSQINSLQDQRSLHVVTQDFIPTLESEIQYYDEWRANYNTENTKQSTLASPVGLSTLGLVRASQSIASTSLAVIDEEDLSTELSISGRNTEDRARLLHNIKKKAFASVGQVSCSNRHRQAVIEDGASSSPPSTSPKKLSQKTLKPRLTRARAQLKKKKLKEST